MVSNIILAILALFVIVGLARPALKDFNFHSLTAILFFAAVIALTFIPNVAIGAVRFNIGAVVFFWSALALFLFRGKFASKGAAFLITLVIGGILYSATRIFAAVTTGYMTHLNVVYALIAGALAMLFTRNAKYSFISAITAIYLAALALQIGSPIWNLGAGFEFAVIAGATALVLHGFAARLMSRPGKYSYYYEIGRLKD